MSSSQPGIREKWVTAASFVVVIFALGVVSGSRWTISSRTVSADEKRRLAACPHLRLNLPSIEAFPAGFTSFYNDRFAFRNVLLSAVDLLQYKAFACSSSAQVLVGRHDWLFFKDGGDEETLRGVPAFTTEEIEHFVKLFEARRAWLAARKIRYLVFFPPSKCNVYREEVPSAYSKLNERSRQDEMLAALRANTSIEVVDVRPALMRGKKLAPLYYKTDTHWNRVGCFLAYLEVINRIKDWFPSIRPLASQDLEICPYKFGDGDLATMMGLRDLIPEMSLACALKKPRWHYSTDPPLPNLADASHNRDPFATEVNDSTLPKAFCLRDSFMQMPLIYFGANFRRIRYQWEFGFPTALIEKEKPDIVIQEITERFLVRSGYFSNPPAVERMIRPNLFAVRGSKVKLAQTKSLGAE